MKNGTVTSLDERILSAFADGTKPQDVEALIATVEAAASEASTEADAARTRAMDPTLVAASVVAARKAMDDAVFKSDRMQAAASRLRERLIELRAIEENARRELAYQRAKSTRDGLMVELEEAAPWLHRLADLAARLELSDREIKNVDQALPRGGAFLQLAEGAVAGMLRYDAAARDAICAFARDIDPQRAPVEPVRLVQRQQLVAERAR